ncbi:MAG: GDSL-type esterase/lipase family protein [Arachnia sp.]
MPAVPLPHADVDIVGALDFERTMWGVVPRRLPAWTRRQAPKDMEWQISSASGVRIRFATRATRVQLTLRGGRHPGAVRVPSLVSLLVNGEPDGDAELRRAVPLTDDFLASGQNNDETLVFDDLAPVLKTLELWLPNTCVVELRRLAASAPIERAEPDQRPSWWHYGSSISQATGAYGPLGTWVAAAAFGADVRLTSLGFGGQAMLDPFVARTIRDSDADLISCCLGINIHNRDTMRARTFAPAVHGFLDTIREGHPTTPLLVISPIAFPAGEDCPGPLVFDDKGIAHPVGDPAAIADGALSVGRIREILAEVLAARGNDENLCFLDGRDLLGMTESTLLVDGLHPTPAGYDAIARRFVPRAQALGFFPAHA